MAIDTKTISQLRQETGVGIIECKKALEEANGDLAKAKELLRKRGAQKAEKRAERSAGEGVIASYVHANKKIAALVELNSETDFVARNEEFQQVAKDIAMQVVAASPKYLSREEVPAEEIEKEKEIYREQLKKENKPDDIIEKILEGKMNKYFEEVCLLEQDFIKDEDKKVKDLVDELVAKMGEKIAVKRFVRFQI